MLEGSTLGSDFKPLTGTDEATIDDKGRILIGKKKRERLGDNFVIALSETGVLAAYPEATWRAMCMQIAGTPAINLGRQQYARLVVGTAEDDLNCDAQGRVVINKKLQVLGRFIDKEGNQITDKVMLVGAFDKLEIWAKPEWEKYEEDPDSYGRQRLEAITKAVQVMQGQ